MVPVISNTLSFVQCLYIIFSIPVFITPLRVNTSVTDTYCPLLWNHINLRPDNQVYPCCRFTTPLTEFTGDLTEAINTEEMSDLRKKSISGVPIDGCQKCYTEDQQGIISWRKYCLEKYGYVREVDVKYLEVSFDNICNLACDGCYNERSLEWAKKDFPEAREKDLIISTAEIIDLPSTLNEVSFLGGEPLMTSRHFKLLQGMEDISQANVSYTTNGSFLFTPEQLDLLNKANNVEIIVSIDGYEELNSKVREFSVWQDILNFLNQVSEYDFELLIHSTIHKNNLHGVKDLYNFVVSNDYAWRVNLVTYPDHLCVKHMDKKLLSESLVEVCELMDLNQIDHTLNLTRLKNYLKLLL